MLLQALPRATRVLEIAGSDGQLAMAFRQANPACQWVHADAGDRVEGQFDLVVLNDSLGALPDPVTTLSQLHPHLSPGARLAAAVTNGAHAQVAAQALMGDLTYSFGGLLNPQAPRLYSQASAYK